ncbi:hypothetical protein H8L32_02275 [Undibacterium sp. CY18W]|uniref:Phosphate ABC transporter substrate-binding protein n=1 Tax=Undibacterium hunanense TaxID=2762292 RepID=A0ABR6ZKB6_9BURK|nr:hypothetical protein [Undibacterium hunanense]MBC3916303.1 hypothetical protein [Undibacterium hunanense]
MKIFHYLTVCLVLAIWHGNAIADLVVIANPQSGIEKLSKDEVINLYMGRNRKLASGINALPVDLATSNVEKARFYSMLVNKNLPEINSYWARLMFSGQGTPPHQADTSDEVMDIVSSNKGAIGYIERKKLDKRVKLIYDPNINN